MFTEMVVVRSCVLLEQEEDVNIVAEMEDILLFHMSTLHTSFEDEVPSFWTVSSRSKPCLGTTFTALVASPGPLTGQCC